MLISLGGYLLALLGAIAILIVTHELGHFLVARILGIKILRFSIGFGRALVSKKTASGTEFSIGLIPLGGYVKMLDEREGSVLTSELSQAFNRQAWWKRMAVIAAGPLLNFIVALVIFSIVYSLGIRQLKPIIADTVPQSIAAQANIQADSLLTKIDGRAVYSWTEVVFKLLYIVGSKDSLSLETCQHSYQLNIKHWQLDPLRPDPIHSLGIIPKRPSAQELEHNFDYYLPMQRYIGLQAITVAGQQLVDYFVFNCLVSYKLMTGTLSLKSLTGPLALFQGINQAMAQGGRVYLYMLGILSIAIGFINLLPIPGLDGGHLLFLVLEAIRGKPMSIAAQVLAHRLGMIVIGVLLMQGLANDLLRF